MQFSLLLIATKAFNRFNGYTGRKKDRAGIVARERTRRADVGVTRPRSGGTCSVETERRIGCRAVEKLEGGIDVGSLAKNRPIAKVGRAPDAIAGTGASDEGELGCSIGESGHSCKVWNRRRKHIDGIRGDRRLEVSVAGRK